MSIKIFEQMIKYFFKNNLAKQKNGFSIMEVMIAITIFSIGLIGISSLMLQTMQAESLNAGYLKASMLAQEGVELVRGLRDENWLRQDATSWDQYLVDTDGTFIIDYNGTLDDTPNNIDDAGTFLGLNANNFYDHEWANQSSYRRLITIDNTTCGTDCWNVKSHVRWTSSGKINNYVAETVLYDWR